LVQRRQFSPRIDFNSSIKKEPFVKLSPLVVACVPFLASAIAGCGGTAEEVAPPTQAPEMSAEEKANYEKQMEMMKQNRK
jgi:hypothetical protein